MISQLKEMLRDIVALLDMGESGAAMKLIALFTVNFEDFLRQNQNYIFTHEMFNLNRCLTQMMVFMEEQNLPGLQEVINTTFVKFLEDWDFANKPGN